MANRGSNYLPSPGGGGKIPSGTAPSLPKPKAAPNSGKAGKVPAPVSGKPLPLRKGL
jgi:hypothetical protein